MWQTEEIEKSKWLIWIVKLLWTSYCIMIFFLWKWFGCCTFSAQSPKVMSESPLLRKSPALSSLVANKRGGRRLRIDLKKGESRPSSYWWFPALSVIFTNSEVAHITYLFSLPPPLHIHKHPRFSAAATAILNNFKIMRRQVSSSCSHRALVKWSARYRNQCYTCII